MRSNIIIPLLALAFFSCSQSEEEFSEEIINEEETYVPRTDLSNLDLPVTPFNYSEISLPAHFSTTEVVMADNTPNDNPVTDEGATLGRVLFYDRAMSLNNTTACASCHTQATGFADNNALSTGFDGGLTGRNSMGLSNAKYYQSGHFFWDERAATLEDQVLMPIQDQVEMGMSLDSLVSRLSATDYYPVLFSEAFGDEEVTSERISLALAQFVRSMVSYESPFDQALEASGGDPTVNLTGLSTLENLGRDLFFGRGGCDNCHQTALFIADQPFNNGLDAETGIDDGVGNISGRANDRGLFKVTSLRNIALGAPFMHDGRFETLREVVEFYNDEVQDHPNLSREMRGRNGEIRRLNLNTNEINALVAFMESLTDQSFVTDRKFSDPFVND